jgi:AraC family transcriptional regulator
MNAIRESLSRVEDLPLVSSSRDKWDGVVVEAYDVKGASEIALPPQDHHFVAVVLGGVTHCVQRRDSQSFRSIVRPGSVMVVPAGVASYFNCSRDHKTSRAVVPLGLLMSAASELGFATRDEPELRSVFESRDATIANLISILLDEVDRSPHPAQALIAASCSCALAAHLIRTFDASAQTLPKAPASLDARRLEAVLDYIEGSMSESIGLAEIAAVARVSRFHFARLFRASAGISPMAYVERSRIERAKSMLKHGSMRLADIAAATGFSDQSHFTRRFRLHTGVTPGRYEREARTLRPRTSSVP